LLVRVEVRGCGIANGSGVTVAGAHGFNRRLCLALKGVRWDNENEFYDDIDSLEGVDVVAEKVGVVGEGKTFWCNQCVT